MTGFAAFALALVSGPAAAQSGAPGIGPGLGPEDGIVTTRHAMEFGSGTLEYVARAGRIPIRENDAGESLGHMFFVSYSLGDGPAEPDRPITFLWNGGPGSSSSLVHLLGFGPKRLDPAGAPRPNEGTWLGSTDLVFVDPIGTGYSRPARAEHGTAFYQNRGDAESVAEFIRVYLTRSDAWDRPLFLAGESFGVLRAIRVADVLQRQDIPVAGLILIGLVPPLADIPDEMRTALAVPTYAAAAHFHGRLDPDVGRDFDETLRATESWSRDVYARALARRSRLTSPERIAVSSRLADLIGVPAEAVDSTLTVETGTFARTLLADEGLVVGRYDSRLTGPLPVEEGPYDPTRDPSLSDIIDDVGVIRYMRDELGYRSDLRYQGPFGGGYPSSDTFRGDWMSVRWDWSEDTQARVDDRATDPRPAVERVMRADESLRVYVACGTFDLVCPYALIDYMVGSVDRELAGRVSVHTYRGGHAIYTDDDARPAMRADVAAFIESTTRRRR
jgi:carboxypeptidase C (cathepsin A)